ncbi:MAG: recombinase XerC [Zetaproteobacteria bacterium]|nr:MAG: recombinase XerC [Zetaproteobacteria bacterium]
MSEFNAINEKFKKEYEDALIHGAHKEVRTVDAAWKAINMFENFTGKKDFITFNTKQAKDFKRWLMKQKNKEDQPLSVSTVSHILSNVREFFKWLAMHPKCIRKVDGQAVAYLRMSNNDERAGRATRQRPSPTIEQYRKALDIMPSDTDIEKRNRAIFAFAALTVARDAAIVSLKMKDIDLDAREVWQNPRHVKTKNRKSITTVFMPFDPVWEEIFVDWFMYARDTLGFKGDDALFPKETLICDPDEMKFKSAGLSREHWANAAAVRSIFKDAFKNAGLPHCTPHSVRNMIVNWAMEHCTQYQFKAISQNIGHESVMTSYNAYGNFNMDTQRSAILSIGEGHAELVNVSYDELLEELSKRKVQQY